QKKLAEVKGREQMDHVCGDNMAERQQPLGGGGERIACGVFK
ncbi:superoxide dismutase [Cu-Zn] SodC2, partial [Klebsiella quasipneumoniae]|nr:superoxide dismutase [Cu-Zn] SodC2 [Klebsiella quasipneumoniae]